jgi:hypothetical protein
VQPDKNKQARKIKRNFDRLLRITKFVTTFDLEEVQTETTAISVG